MNNVVYQDYETHIINYVNTHEPIIVGIGKNDRKEILKYIPMGFDIETTTQYTKIDGVVTEHYSNMYIWQFQFDYITFIGRTWEELVLLIKAIETHICNACFKTIVFICNMSFEFQFIAKALNKLGHSTTVFAREKRKPMKWVLDDKIIFLDTVMLTHLTLEKLAENYCTTKKLVGDLDYSLLRNKYTTLDEIELQYCINDVIILKEYSEFYYNEYLSNSFMPLTQTMIANKVVKDKIKELKCQKQVYSLMKKCYPKTENSYKYIMSFYTGAYTHGMLQNLFETHINNLAYDVVSGYPYIMLTKKVFPITPFRKLKDISNVNLFLDTHCCLLEVTFTNIKSIYGVTILSQNKVINVINGVWDNGRLYKADSVQAKITEIDLKTLSLHYNFNYEITSCIYAERGYLPNYLRLAIVDLYNDKTLLKGVNGKEKEYLCSKEKLNAQYGSMCTLLEFTEITFNEDWEEHSKEIDFNKIYQSKNKLPQWAIYVTSAFRYHVLSAIKQICVKNPKDYLYSDTDSIKSRYRKYILELFENINKKIVIDNINGYMKDLNLQGKHFENLGTWDLEHSNDFKKIKILGSKRYICQYDDRIETTIAGLPKQAFKNYCDKNNLDYFKTFTENGLFIDEEYSQKLCTYYEDNEKTFTVLDYQGNIEEVTTQSYVSLIPTTFNLSVTNDLISLYCQLLNN